MILLEKLNPHRWTTGDVKFTVKEQQQQNLKTANQVLEQIKLGEGKGRNVFMGRWEDSQMSET